MGRQTSPESQLGVSYPGEITQSRSSFLGALKSVPLLFGPHPTQQAPLHQQQDGGVHSGTHRTRAPVARLQSSLPLYTYFRPLSLQPTFGAVTPGPADTDVPDQVKDYISQGPRRHSPPASPNIPESIMGKWVGLPSLTPLKI